VVATMATAFRMTVFAASMVRITDFVSSVFPWSTWGDIADSSTAGIGSA
jgi:hypothetical protein